MYNSKTTYAIFPFEWTVKSTSCQIRYRKAFDINEIDEIFCSIINAKENIINISDLAILLGFNLQDLAEIDVLNIYLKNLSEFNLIEIKQGTIQLTASGQEALQSKLKYKYYFSFTELFENQTATGENFDFSFKSIFDLENQLSHIRDIKDKIHEHQELEKKLQFQLFGKDIYKGEIVELYECNTHICYKKISLQIEIIEVENKFQLAIFKSGANKHEIQNLIDLPENAEIKGKLLRKGMYHHILSEKNSITRQDIEAYKDLWNWKELAENPKVDWEDKTIFELFCENGDGSIWVSISEKAPIETLKSVIQHYAEYWNWTTLTERFDNVFIKEQIENFDWDFGELSYKATDFVISLLSNTKLKNRNWDWNYLSKTLPDEYIENHIEDLNWDFFAITESKSKVLKNTFNAYQGKLDALISKNWNWQFISKEINLNFLYNNISGLASKLNWHTVLIRFFCNEEITAKCLKDDIFKKLLKLHLPEDYVVAHQKYHWTIELIDFLEELNLIHWESKKYIQGFDTNESVEWKKTIFKKYHAYITTESGFLNVSRNISDYSLIEEYIDFAWNWEAISQNKRLLSNPSFIENAIIGELTFSNNLVWYEILLHSNFDISFWNKNLEVFYNTTESEKQIQFWKTLTQKEKTEFVLANKYFPWDWRFVTENCSEDIILDSFDDKELFGKWDWEIATRKIEKNTILGLLKDFAPFVDWKYLINEVFTVENELAIDEDLVKIADCLTLFDSEKRKELWKDITKKFPFKTLFPIIEATKHLVTFDWDWDYISNHKQFPTDFGTINLFREKINWGIFSANESIQKKFSYRKDEWTYKEYFNYILKYLKSYSSNWNWNKISRISDLNNNRDIVSIFQEKWDWKYLSEFGAFLLPKKRDNFDYLLTLLSGYPLIEFTLLSKRKDIKIDSSLILEYRNKYWDWQVLSENEKAEITNDLILELTDKNWNWQALSKRKNIKFNNETLLQLIDKAWDWNYLSKNENIVFNAEFIEKTKIKPWNWRSISRHKSFLPTFEILTLTSDFDIDWEYLSQHSSLNPTKELLAKFETKWDWWSITQNPQIDFTVISLIERFADRWNWRFICESGKLILNNQILNQFKEFLKWDLISANTNINFTKEIIQEFKQYWNWTALKENKRVEELLGSYVADEISKSASLHFIDKIEQQYSQWKGHIYHFSHIENAVEIIKNRTIQSRNKATIKGDAAGNVVHLKDDAHDYARFYFRPHTPTQFYNEFLGKNTTDGYNSSNFGWVSWYEKARGLGFPKCPIPIFFKFSIQDILFKFEKQCFISNGNMQTGSTQFGSVEKMLNKFGFDDLYYTPEQYATKEDYNRYRNYAQQEFLVKDELSFNNLSAFEIICPSEADRTLLINLLGNEHKDIFSKIVVDSNYYNHENPRVRIEEEDSELHISTNFSGKGYFVLNSASIKEMEILLGDVTKATKDKIIFKSNISLGSVKQNIKLNFVDESNRNWFLYENKTSNTLNPLNKLQNTDFEELELLINSELSKNLSYKRLTDILNMQGNGWSNFEDNYDPIQIYKKEFLVDFRFDSTLTIDYDKINFLILKNWNNKIFKGIKKCKNLIAIYKLDISDIDKHQIEFLKEHNVDLVHNGWSDWFFDSGQLYYHKIIDLLNEVKYNPAELISYIMKREPFFSAFNTKIRHYKIIDHTLLVCNQFELYFESKFNVKYKPFIRLMLLIHDVGKGMIKNSSNTVQQYAGNSEIINMLIAETANCNSFDSIKLNILPIFITHDLLGMFFQDKISQNDLKKNILDLSIKSNIEKMDLLYYLMIYYQCDIASYTEDAGGIKFLEHLFTYQNGAKVFDKEEGLLKMSTKYWEMYKHLKNEIGNDN